MQVEITGNNVGGWIEARKSEEIGEPKYYAYWGEILQMKKYSYKIKKVDGDVTTYFRSSSADLAALMTEFGTNWTNRATLTYQEWVELI